MKVFKFGGASVKDANSVKNVARILQLFSHENLIVVISAMGKNTNALEKLTDAFFYKKENKEKILEEIKQYHFRIVEELFPDKQHAIYSEVHNSFIELDWIVERAAVYNYDQEYDQIVSIGEIVSTQIVSAYLNEAGIKNTWKDVRDWIRTDSTYREAKVDWEITSKLVQDELTPFFSGAEKKIIVTQGFIGGTSENFTTTLGREGSDYTAAVLAYTTNAEEVIIWKDVPGVLNADPRWFSDTILLKQLSYQDAIELTYYGATVIHPKTIKPLQNKNIPLRVKSFVNPEDDGTLIHNAQYTQSCPCYVIKSNQLLISIFPKDFSFIVEENLSKLFATFVTHQIKINLMQHAALTFSICIDNVKEKVVNLLEALQHDFRILYNEGLTLMTIRYYNEAIIEKLAKDKQIMLEQRSRTTLQLILK